MYDIERINTIVRDIERYFSELESFGLTKETANDKKIFYASSMALFGILNRSIDLATEIIVKNEFGMPQNYENYFELLGKEGIISIKLAEEMQRLMSDRNLFAHEYFNVNLKQVLDISKRIYFVKEFVEKVKEVVRKSQIKKWYWDKFYTIFFEERMLYFKTN